MGYKHQFEALEELISMCNVYVMHYWYWKDHKKYEDGTTIIAKTWDDAMGAASELAKLHGLETWGGDCYEIISVEKVSVGTINVASIEDYPFSRNLIDEINKLYDAMSASIPPTP